MLKGINKKSLIEFSKGKYSYNDYLKIKDWFTRPENQEEQKEYLYPQWIECIEKEKEHKNDLDPIFKKIHYHILLDEKAREGKRVLWRHYRQIAAVLIIALISFGAWYFLNTNKSNFHNELAWAEIYAPYGSRVEFMLPDSSTGWLNSGSKLKYPVNFEKERKVELTGEGYFEVKHLNNAEFIVSIPDMDIRVHGTKFNVCAYPDDAFSDVVLEKGKVEVSGKTSVFNYFLNPNDKITFNREQHNLTLNQVDALKSSAWTKGYLIIDNESLEKALGRIERWYNVDIEIVDEPLKKYRYKATFKDEPLEEVLRLIAKTTPIKYTIEERTTDKNGVIKQKKVIIKLK